MDLILVKVVLTAVFYFSLVILFTSLQCFFFFFFNCMLHLKLQGNVIPVEQTLANHIHSPVTEVSCTTDQTSVATVPVIPVQAAAKNAVASYKKHYALTRRSFSSPTILVKHGHKVQRLMVSGTSPPTMYNGQILNTCSPSDTGDGSDTYIRYTHLPGHSAASK